MGKKKQKNTTSQSFSQQTPDTPDIIKAREGIANVDFHSPIVAQYGQMENEVNNEVFEEALPDGIKERIRLGKLFNLKMNKGAALSDAASREASFKSGNQMSLAGMTAGRTGTSSGTNYGESWGGTSQVFANSLASSLGQS